MAAAAHIMNDGEVPHGCYGGSVLKSKQKWTRLKPNWQEGAHLSTRYEVPDGNEIDLALTELPDVAGKRTHRLSPGSAGIREGDHRAGVCETSRSRGVCFRAPETSHSGPFDGSSKRNISPRR